MRKLPRGSKTSFVTAEKMAREALGKLKLVHPKVFMKVRDFIVEKGRLPEMRPFYNHKTEDLDIDLW